MATFFTQALPEDSLDWSVSNVYTWRGKSLLTPRTLAVAVSGGAVRLDYRRRLHQEEVPQVDLQLLLAVPTPPA